VWLLTYAPGYVTSMNLFSQNDILPR